ncbi:phage/plasmid replication protein, II/X family [Paraburkholderia fungorum]|uniref:phage/plasmid replication protein, II/X family n=1 Tax=Paraburkholderia fungorum TaxID=134537 RepID=UPI001C1EE70D|nr:phage/plasmid replication protein, II/X family [Paraburkholderia fungorum]MBU7442149.1 phage/plasmid replication protein, II/X family [Paraburkholderia fungorum]
MIDLLAVEIAHRHRAFGNKRIKISRDRQRKITCFSAAVGVTPGGAKIKATSLRNGTAISIVCNPLKVLQGHNVFGENNLRVLAPEIIVRVLKHLNVAYTDDDVAAWVAGEFDIHAIDITHRYRLPENVTVFDIRRHMIRNMPIERYRQAALEHGIGVRFNAAFSYAAWLIYDKYKEMEDKRTHAYPVLAAVHGDQADDVWNLLTATAKRSARVELKLEKKYLEQHDLNRGSAWTALTANEAFDRELAALRLDHHMPMSVLRDSIAAVTNPVHRRTLEMWAHGCDLKNLFCRASLAVHRKAILGASGIDIDRDIPAVEPLPLSELFGAHNCMNGRPKWVDCYPLAYAFSVVPTKSGRSSVNAPRKSRWDIG